MKIVKLLLGIWAYLPVFALTDDLGYLTANPELEERKYYFSLISILFGEKKYQFISIPIKQPGEKIKIFRVERLSEIDSFELSEEKAEELVKKYKEHYDSLDACDCEIEKEALTQHLTSQQSRIDISYNKINAFTTIIVAVIPLAITLIDKEILVSLNIFEKIILGLLIYATVNLCAWIFQAIDVRGYMASTFRDLKESNEKAKERNCQIYYDWQQTRRKADMFVSFVKYTKNWIIAVIILAVLFFAGVPFVGKTTLYPDNNQAYTFQVNFIEKTYHKSAVEWYNILAQLQTDDYTKILILHNEADITKLLEKLKRFSHQEINMISDNSLKKNEIKIILEK